jgi:hypothetical protein
MRQLQLLIILKILILKIQLLIKARVIDVLEGQRQRWPEKTLKGKNNFENK